MKRIKILREPRGLDATWVTWRAGFETIVPDEIAELLTAKKCARCEAIWTPEPDEDWLPLDTCPSICGGKLVPRLAEMVEP